MRREYLTRYMEGKWSWITNLYGVQACSLTRMRIMLRQPSAKTGLFALGDWAWKERLG
jgi:hypothetical protein